MRSVLAASRAVRSIVREFAVPFIFDSPSVGGVVPVLPRVAVVAPVALRSGRSLRCAEHAQQLPNRQSFETVVGIANHARTIDWPPVAVVLADA